MTISKDSLYHFYIKTRKRNFYSTLVIPSAANGNAAGSKAFSHLETTVVANAFPNTLVALRPISSKGSIPKINNKPASGI